MNKLIAFLVAILLAGETSILVVLYPPLRNSWNFFIFLLFNSLSWIGFVEYIRRLLVREKKKNKQKDVYIASVAHEIKTPLTALKIQVYMLQKTSPKLAAIISHEINRVLYLTERIINFSKLTTKHYTSTVESFCLKETIDDIVEKLQLVYPAIVFQQHLPEKITPIISDKYALEQIITNLITNAIKYGKEKPIDIYLRKEDSHFILQVKDRGDGIPVMFHKNIFTPFAQYDTKSSGLGIGLYITKQLVGQCRGKITFETSNIGTIFEVSLPLR